MKHRVKITPILVSVVLFYLSGCANSGIDRGQAQAVGSEKVLENSTSETTIASKHVSKKSEKPKKPLDYPVAPFEDDSLYELLVAEVAGYRQDYDTALEKYMEMTETTRDAGVAARATRLANYLKRHDMALKAAQIWAEVEPDNIDAHRHSADQLMRSGDLEGAVHHMEAVRNLGGLANFDVFAFRAANLDSAARASLLNAITGLLALHPEDVQLKFSRAVLLEQQGELEEALALADELLADAQQTNVIILKVNTLKSLHRAEDAINFLKQVINDKQGDNRRLRLMYARFLFEAKRLDDARLQYEFVLEEVPHDGDILFALALIALEQDKNVKAEAYLDQMIRWNRRVGEAHFYLGSLAEKNKQTPKAIREYKQVGMGYEFLPAQARIAGLILEQGRLDEMQRYFAKQRLNHPRRATQLLMIELQALSQREMSAEVFKILDLAIENKPESIELLYFRAMTGQRFGMLDVLEQDLQRVIELDPQNSDALNALGYTLTDQMGRHEDALALIDRALVIKPDEAAYIDSMGWVQFHLNNLDEAVKQLRRALELFVNDEVAAHLGEVLWVSGQKVEAGKILLEALDVTPDSEILKKVIERLGVQ